MKILAAAALASALALPGEARVWTVGGTGSDFPLIAPAIRAASAGDVIRVREGVYREDLVVDRTLSLVGEGTPLLIGTGQGTVVTISAPGCRLRGFRIEGSGLGETNLMDAAVAVESSRSVVEDNAIERVFYGIVVRGGSDNRIAGNRIRGLSELPYGRRGDGIYLYRAPGNLVERNTVDGMRDGLYLQYSPACRILGNRVQECRYALHDMYSDGEEISGNVFRASSVGANVMNCRGVKLSENRFESNRGVASVGLSLKECDRSKVERNDLVDNGRGLQVEESSGNRFAGNRFAYNGTAVELFASSEQNVFTRNDFDRNLTAVVLSGGASTTSWSESGVGNRWSGYEGFDFEGRGIGREPHSVVSAFERIEGNNPAARLFLASPAAAALDFATRGTAAGIEGSTDRYPLVRPLSPRRAGGGHRAAFVAAGAVFGLAGASRRRSRG